MRKLTEKQIKEDLRLHDLWHQGHPEGKRLGWAGANLKEANLEEAILEGAIMRGANLEEAILEGANLEGANLKEAYLVGANLAGANLRGAIMRGADLEGANLEGADLEGANLEEAILEGANLRGANLRGADLEGANLEGANLDCACWPLWCGGTRAKLDTRGSLQLIYHAFNQDHLDPEIRAALEPLRPFAQRFIDGYRHDATPLRMFDGKENK